MTSLFKMCVYYLEQHLLVSGLVFSLNVTLFLCCTHRTTGLIIVFSQYLRLIPIPVPSCCKTKKRKTSKFYIFQTMPV